jgi:ABC-type multidrug transport system fused ATPase/permease subunit
MKNKTFIKDIIVVNKKRLVLTYFLFSVEMVAGLVKPYFLGEAVNDLLKGGYKILIVFLMVHLAWLLVSMLRMRYDTRTYTSIYNDIITKFLAKNKEEKNVSKLSALSTLSREYTDFLEYDLIFILESFYNIIGSLCLIFFYDKIVLFICIITLVPVLFLSKYYGRKMGILTKQKNDELEKQVDTIATYDEEKIKNHYNYLQKWQIKISDQQALNFGIMELFVLVLLGGSLVISTHFNSDKLNAGQIISFYFYLLKFTSGLDTIPYITEKYASLKDITKRMLDYVQ